MKFLIVFAIIAAVNVSIESVYEIGGQRSIVQKKRLTFGW